MRLEHLSLTNFRNYGRLELQLPAEPTLLVLTGDNAQGKSNLLEAIAVLLTGRSFRTSRLAEIPRWGAETTSLAGELRRVDGMRTVRRSLKRREDGAWLGSGRSEERRVGKECRL